MGQDSSQPGVIRQVLNQPGTSGPETMVLTQPSGRGTSDGEHYYAVHHDETQAQGEPAENRLSNRSNGVFGGMKGRSVIEEWYARVDSNHRPFAPEANALSI